MNVPVGMGSDSRQKFIWQRRCGRHLAELQVQAGNKTGSWVNCIYCDSEAALPKGIQPASSYAALANSLLRYVRGVQHIITEAKVLGGTFGPFDFSLLLLPRAAGTKQRRLEVDVDGEQHLVKGMYDTSLEQQREADQRKDEEAWRQGCCVLRLHYQDDARWLRLLQDAVDCARQQRPQRFIIYSHSYGKHNRMGPLQVSKGRRQHSHRIGWGCHNLWCTKGWTAAPSHVRSTLPGGSECM